MTAPVNSYDVVPYPSTVFRSTHPDTLATLATLVGLSPAAPGRCRYLELGCSDGGNLIPMAYANPESEFVGVDLSASQIASGREKLEALGLQNLRLHQLDLTTVDDSFGQFDFVATHGVFSWVPTEVQERILAVSKARLAPQGVAYVSYNTLPGWHMRSPVREMMLFHVRRIQEPQARIAEARKFLDFLAEKVGLPEMASLTATDAAAYAASLRYEQNLLKQYADSYMFHEHLEDVNQPVYFSDFAQRAAGHGLQYLSEADFVSAQAGNYPAAVAEAVRSLTGDVVELQQYLDFLCNRTFRQTLLCHADLRLQRSAAVASLEKFYLASPIRPESGTVDLSAAQEEVFATHVGKSITVNLPLVKAAFTHLGAIWPNYITFQSLLAQAREMVSPGTPHVLTSARLQEEVSNLGTAILSCFSQGVVEFHVQPTPFVTSIGAMPAASPAARMQAAAGPSVANQRHENVTITDIDRCVIAGLDGQHDHAALFNILAEQAASGIIVIQRADGVAPETDEEKNALLLQALNQSLQRLAGSALLIA